MELQRIDSEKEINKPIQRLVFTHDGEMYTITPDHKGFRVHKHSLDVSMDDSISVTPAYTNEIIIK